MGYNSFAELKQRVNRLRALAGLTAMGQAVKLPHRGLEQFFFRKRIAIVSIRHDPSRDPGARGLIDIRLPPHDGEAVTHYFLWSEWSSNAKRNGVNWSDALARRVGKDSFRILWTKQEFLELY